MNTPASTNTASSLAINRILPTGHHTPQEGRATESARCAARPRRSIRLRTQEFREVQDFLSSCWRQPLKRIHQALLDRHSLAPLQAVT